MDKYTTVGDVRGACGHNHRTIDAAQRCVDKDQRNCERQGGYSDRSVVRSDGTPLTEEEFLWLTRDR